MCQFHGGAPSHKITVRGNSWPADIGGHTVYKEQDLSEGVFYFYCGDCDYGNGLGVCEVTNATGGDRARITKYVLGMFMLCDCDEDGHGSGAVAFADEVSIEIEKSGTNSISVDINGDIDIETASSIAESISEKKMGCLNTAANRSI
jgi:hypothetical protein